MSDSERVIGALTEFKSATERRLVAIESKIDALNQFKWRVAGGAAVLSVILTALMKIVEVMAK